MTSIAQPSTFNNPMKPFFDSSTISLLEKVAIFGERRHEVLAGNIANINTPNYRMRDLPVDAFQSALKRAVEQLRESESLPASLGTADKSAKKTIDELFPQTLFDAVKSPPSNITFQDANNRSIERQIMELTKNNMMQNFAIELMRAQYGMLQTAISERL